MANDRSELRQSKLRQDTSSEAAGQFLLDLNDLAQPAGVGIAARYARLAFTGQLYVDERSISRAIANSKSPMADQILDTAEHLKSQDWRFLKVAPKEGFLFSDMRRYLTYSTSGWKGELQHILGFGHGQIKESALMFSHEIGHYDTKLLDYDVEKADLAASQTMIKRKMVGEGRAMLTESHMAEYLKPSTARLIERQVRLKDALKTGTLADFMATTHWYTRDLPVAQGNILLNNYLEKSFGSDLIDPITNKVRPFKLSSGYGQAIVTPLPEDATMKAWYEGPRGDYIANRKFPTNDPRHLHIEGHPLQTEFWQKTKFLRAGESPLAEIVGHGGRALAAGGLLLAVSDVVGQYQQGFSNGNGRVVRMGCAWMGYEAGASAIKKTALQIAVRRPFLATALTVGTALVGSLLLDKTMGEGLENAIKSGS